MSNTGSVPFMMTKRMEMRLLALGHTQTQINGMTPTEAWDILSDFDGADAIASDEDLMFNHSAQPLQPTRDDLLKWLFDTFVIEPSRGFALMNPVGKAEKYIRRNESLTLDLLFGALNGQTRRVPIGGGDGRQWVSVAYSLAITPQTTDDKPLARNISLDIDTGGTSALAKVLDVCKMHGLRAFAQESESPTHSGGHVHILGEELLPAPMLHEIGQRIAQAAGVEAEVYPKAADIRLPLMMHLRAPGGPRRFPLLLPTGEMIDASDVWHALERLHLHYQVNLTTAFTVALVTLPALPSLDKQMQPRHKSDVNGGNVATVIGWFNSNFPLHRVLEDAGAIIDRPNVRLVCCPFHDDKHPSMGIFRTPDDKTVCHCFTPGCKAHGSAYLDAFDVYCLHHNLSASDAVKRLVEQYELGKKRETVVEIAPAPHPIRTVAEHNQQIADARRRLADELQKATGKKGHVTGFNVTPGLGKTYTGALMANIVYSQHKDSEPGYERIWLPDGQFRPHKMVAICAPTKEIAENEWLPRLINGHMWLSRIELCVCFSKEFLAACIANGYMMPECTNEDCPYKSQAQRSYGKQIIYQHQHLHIKEGYKFVDTDLLIIDESPLAALLPERHVFPHTINGFLKRHPDDPATPLLTAIVAATKQVGITINDVRGSELMSVIESHLNGGTLTDALKQAKRSPFNDSEPQPPESITKMVPQFLYGLLQVLETEPAKLSYGRCDRGDWGLVWHEKKPLALAAHESMYQPAIIILDGSANKEVYRHLCEPWAYTQIDIDAPISPLVEITQINCTPSTRAVMKEQRKLDNLARQVAQVANKLNVIIDGGVTFKDATETMAINIGGEWLHYGGQRGKNELADARTIAVVCSPTTPPYAIERKALALWPDLVAEWQATGVTGSYVATDERLNAMNRLFTIEELRQAVYRARPLTATAPTKLLVFTPWDLSAIGLQPDQTFTSIEHGNSKEAKTALAEYEQRRKASPLKNNLADQLQYYGDFQKGIIYSNVPPPIGNSEIIAESTSDSHQSRATPPLPAKEGLAPLDELITLVQRVAGGVKLASIQKARMRELSVSLVDREGHAAFMVGPVKALEHLKAMRLLC